MEVGDGLEYLSKDWPSLLLVKRTVDLSIDESIQGFPIDVIHDQVDSLAILDLSVHLDNVGMIN